MVALLAEGVDRNGYDIGPDKHYCMSPSSRRAWIEMSIWGLCHPSGSGASPSSRRAWIEILILLAVNPLYLVALLAEGVDRNFLSSNLS